MLKKNQYGQKVSKKRFEKAWETYKRIYHQKAKGHFGFYSARYSKAKFREQYELAKLAKIKNPARAVASSQRLVDNNFEKKYKKLFGDKAEKSLRDPNKRKDIFAQTIAEMKAQGMDVSNEHEAFEDYYGY